MERRDPRGRAAVTSTNDALVVAVAIVCAAICFARTAVFRRRLGRNPWSVHPNLWLAIGFLFGPIGAGLAFLACATTRVSPAFGGPGPGGAGPIYTMGAPSVSGPPAGWYPDPSGRHEYRFFTGHDWTADVVDNGTHSTDPLPSPPEG